MAKRGKVLRDATAGPGLLMVEGQQYQFSLEGVWQSEVPAKPGLVVDVDFDPSGKVTAIRAVPESQLAKEQADKAKEKGKEIWGSIVAKVGMPNLVAGALLFISWIWLTAVSVTVPFGGKLEFTFWQVLGYLNASNILEVMERNGHGSAGIYGFFALVCLAGPFVQYFWKDKRAVLGGVLPIVFMIIVAIMVRSSITSAMGPVEGTGSIAEMQREAQDEMLKAISLGFGSYLSILASLYFAGVGVKNFLAAKAAGTPAVVQKAAA
ncbi:MAG TPA: hypothetical protein VGF06_08525 [Terriglobales bacterium]|jgi:hypothetical protein